MKISVLSCLVEPQSLTAMSDSLISQCGAMLTRAQQKGLWMPCWSMDKVSRGPLVSVWSQHHLPLLDSWLCVGSDGETRKGAFDSEEQVPAYHLSAPISWRWDHGP